MKVRGQSLHFGTPLQLEIESLCSHIAQAGFIESCEIACHLLEGGTGISNAGVAYHLLEGSTGILTAGVAYHLLEGGTGISEAG